MIKAEQILKNHNLKNTGCRKFIVNELLKHNTALSENEIKQALPDLFDRVTFYRSLKTLEENEIIHRIILHDTSVKYALNKNILPSGEHAHFHCIECNDVVCLETPLNVKPNLPNGFIFESAQVLLEGVCASCQKKHHPGNK